jgi:hypothetical protein
MTPPESVLPRKSKRTKFLIAAGVFASLFTWYFLLDCFGMKNHVDAAINAAIVITLIAVGVASILMLLTLASAIASICNYIEKNGAKLVINVGNDDDDAPWRESLKPDNDDGEGGPP